MRLSPRTLRLIEIAQTLRGSVYAGETRTALVELAIENMLGSLMKQNGQKQV